VSLIANKYGLKKNPLTGKDSQRVPGTGPAGYRVPEYLLHGPEGSVTKRGWVVEVKASSGTKFGDLPSRDRKQIKDYVSYAKQLRSDATAMSDKDFTARYGANAVSARELYKNAHVQVFSDLPAPKSGKYKKMMDDGYLRWEQG
jgi:hypothetical protein